MVDAMTTMIVEDQIDLTAEVLGGEDHVQDQELLTEEDPDQDLMKEEDQGAEATEKGHTAGPEVGHTTDKGVEKDHVHTVIHHQLLQRKTTDKIHHNLDTYEKCVKLSYK